VVDSACGVAIARFVLQGQLKNNSLIFLAAEEVRDVSQMGKQASLFSQNI